MYDFKKFFIKHKIYAISKIVIHKNADKDEASSFYAHNYKGYLIIKQMLDNYNPNLLSMNIKNDYNILTLKFYGTKILDINFNHQIKYLIIPDSNTKLIPYIESNPLKYEVLENDIKITVDDYESIEKLKLIIIECYIDAVNREREYREIISQPIDF